MKKLMIVAILMATMMVFAGSVALADDCVGIRIDQDAQKIYFQNVEKGFPGVDSSDIAQVIAVGEKVGWNPKQRGLVMIEEGNGEVSASLNALLHKDLTTRFNLAATTTSGQVVWFMVNQLCPNARRALVHETDAPKVPEADGDLVMALSPGGEIISEWLVKLVE